MESVNVRRGSVDRQGSRKRGRGGALNSSPRDRPIGGVSKPNLSLDISSRPTSSDGLFKGILDINALVLPHKPFLGLHSHLRNFDVRG